MRRLFMLLVVALLVAPTGVQAQSSDQSLSDLLDETGVDWDGWNSTAYVIDGLSFDAPLGYAFVGIDLASDDDAADVIDLLPPLFNRRLAQSYDDPSLEFSQVSAGQVGDARYAASADVESDDFSFKVGYLMASVDHYVVIGFTFGILISPVKEVVDYVESTLERLEDEQPSRSKEIEPLLPQLDDLPAGYVVDEDEDSVTPTPAAKPSPTPHVTPTPPPSDTSIHLHGTGSDKESRMVLDAGRYELTFSCSATTGSAELFWNALGTATTLLTTGEDPSVRFYTLTASAVTSVEIQCAGDWVFDVVPI